MERGEILTVRVLVDTNVLIDFIAVRQPFYSYALRIIDACDRKILAGCIAAQSVPDIYYILRKEVSSEDRREILRALCSIFSVEGLDRKKLMNALNDEAFADFEDCLIMNCALSFGADYIITRNGADFVGSLVPAISPEEFCVRFLNEEN